MNVAVLAQLKPRKLITVVLAAVLAAPIAACSPGGAATSAGGTFTMAFTADPGSLDPQKTLDGTALTMDSFGYDPLVGQAASGAFEPALASSWRQHGNDWAFTLRKGVTCSDGSSFTVGDVAANIAFMENPKNGSPLLGTYLPPGITAMADPAAGTVTLRLAKPAPFFLNGLALVPMVCKAGMADRRKLVQGSDGTGPYTLSQAVSGDHYTFTRHAGYAWGPGGATNSAAGAPGTIVFKIVPSQATEANLLLSGAINAASVTSSDQQRLRAARLFSAGFVTPLGEMFFNEGRGHVTADEKVRLALTTALNLAQVRSVYTGGTGTAPTTFTPGTPAPCPGDSITKALPRTSLAAARALLQTDGWKPGPGGIRAKNGKHLSVTLVYPTDIVEGGSAAAELAAQAWGQIGVTVHLTGMTTAQASSVLFGNGAWEITWTGFGVPTPNQLVPVFSGAAPPAGSNFGHFSNPSYDQQTMLGARAPRAQGCPHWLAAETALVQHADAVPFASVQYLTYGSGATFQYVAGNLVPTSVRLTG